jgi:superoxide dismutase
MNGDVKIGKLLCEEDIITKRQLNVALQDQIKGDKRTLGEILVDKEFCTIDDITNVIMKSSEENGHEQHHEAIVEKINPTKKKEPIEISEDKVLGTKFTLSVQTMIAAGTGLASLIGMWYALQAEIQEAKELPSLETLYLTEYPSRPEGYNWPRSFEQYKDNVGSLQEEMDEAFETLEEMEDLIKEIRKEISSLEKRKKDK